MRRNKLLEMTFSRGKKNKGKYEEGEKKREKKKNVSVNKRLHNIFHKGRCKGT